MVLTVFLALLTCVAFLGIVWSIDRYQLRHEQQRQRQQ